MSDTTLLDIPIMDCQKYPTIDIGSSHYHLRVQGWALDSAATVVLLDCPDRNLNFQLTITTKHDFSSCLCYDSIVADKAIK